MTGREILLRRVLPRQSFKPFGVDYFDGKGVMLRGATTPGNPTGKGRGLRGSIIQWSSSSRRRMRAFMLTHDAPGCVVVGATFTVPGEVLPLTVAKALWKDWAREAARSGWGAVWRVELQERGALHWHLLVAIGAQELQGKLAGSRGASRVDPASVVLCEYACILVRRSWHEAVTRLGEAEHKGVVYSTRMAMPGADVHAAVCECNGRRGAWLRYLQDHASKRKQEQVGENIGRHWGVVGRKVFVQVLPDEVCELRQAEYVKLLRVVRRLVRPSVKDDRAPFGRRLGWASKRGAFGRSVWFSSVGTFRSAVAWARASCVSEGGVRQEVE